MTAIPIASTTWSHGRNRPAWTICPRWRTWLEPLAFAKQPLEEDADEEEGRSDSDAAPSENRDAARPPSKNSDDVSDAPESGTREAND